MGLGSQTSAGSAALGPRARECWPDRRTIRSKTQHPNHLKEAQGIEGVRIGDVFK